MDEMGFAGTTAAKDGELDVASIRPEKLAEQFGSRHRTEGPFAHHLEAVTDRLGHF
jgi:hypothetical protein